MEHRHIGDAVSRAELERAKELGRKAKSERTQREYAADWRDFQRFCTARSAAALPATPQTVGLYATHLHDRGLAYASIKRRLVAISQQHKLQGATPSPGADERVHEILKGIARERGAAPKRKDALTIDLIMKIMHVIPGTTLAGVRDRSLLLLGFSGAFRRSELAALDVRHLKWEKRGVIVHLPKSKTDPRGEGRDVAIPFASIEALCPVKALHGWIAAAGITSGAVFRTFNLQKALTGNRIDGRDVARVVQRYVKRAKIDGDFAAHSLRAGFVTSADDAGASTSQIQATTGHRSLHVLSGYIRRSRKRLFESHPLERILGI
ncbi:MAG: site-specific integrase [Candidatus Baltobacteraceae bacterium]